MDYRFVAKHRAGHRSGQRDPRARSKTCDCLRIACAQPGVRSPHDARIARRLLVAPHGTPANPAERVEPVQREQRLHGEIRNQVSPAMVRQLVRQRQIAHRPLSQRKEARRQGNNAVEHAERQRGIGRRRLDQPDRSQPSAIGPAHFARIGEQFAPHVEIGTKAEDEKDQRTGKPGGQPQRKQIER